MNECAALRGSQRWLQVAVNRCRTIIDDAVAQAINLDRGETVEWRSPLESDCFKEYRDAEFLECTDVRPQHRQLADFWPPGGPVWDGLARTSGGRCLLIEAKANIPEFDTSPTGASGKSLCKIEKAFRETREFLKVRSDTDWTKCFYQYANRLAHLYFLKKLNCVDAALVFIYFTGDDTVPDREASLTRGLADGDRPSDPSSRCTRRCPVDSGQRRRRIHRRRRPQTGHMAIASSTATT